LLKYFSPVEETTTLSSNFLEATTSAAKTALEVATAALGEYLFLHC
jgi:hypothetical protein